MDVLIAVLVVVNGLIYSVLGMWSLRATAREPSIHVRMMGRLVMLVCATFIFGAIHRTLLQAARHGILPQSVSTALLTELQLVKSLAAFTLGMVALVVLRRMLGHIRHMETILSVLAGRSSVAVSIHDINLTRREHEVLEHIVAGALTDAEIAQALTISPATAKTHVKNILKKAGLHSRRELVLLVWSHQ
jgi:DNA-binding CsgD family transcriptional regulator